MAGNTYQDLLIYVKQHELESGVKIPYLGEAGLIELKKNSRRPKDQMDIKILQEIMQQSFKT